MPKAAHVKPMRIGPTPVRTAAKAMIHCEGGRPFAGPGLPDQDDERGAGEDEGQAGCPDGGVVEHGDRGPVVRFLERDHAEHSEGDPKTMRYAPWTTRDGVMKVTTMPPGLGPPIRGSDSR